MKKTYTSPSLVLLGNAKDLIKGSHSSRIPENAVGISFYKG
ncbi:MULTISPECIES: hypothetical protein [Mammaliicoccus]|nr:MULTISPECIES: hypothetical protein [Mammaliicoccus]MDT0712208.1 hypothetical protein [Mammaliicoccus sciuri]